MLGARRGASARMRKRRRAVLAATAGVLLQAVWFDAGAEQAGRLLVMIHHFAVGRVSWRILVPELAVGVGGRLRAGRVCRRLAGAGNFVSWLGAAACLACA